MTSGEQLDRALLELRARGLSYQALAAVSDAVYGWRLTHWQVRRRLRALGVQKGVGGRRA